MFWHGLYLHIFLLFGQWVLRGCMQCLCIVICTWFYFFER
jgi:hypothetical protein